MTARRGASSLGCLFTLLIAAAVIYFGINIGEAYWRYYQFQDDMRQEMRFYSHSADNAIITRLRASADSLGLPDAASNIVIRRSNTAISVESEYYVPIEMPGFVRDIHFHPHAEGKL